MSIEIILGLFFLLVLLGIPIAFAIGLVSLLYIIEAGLPLLVVGQRMVAGADSFPLLAAPLFLLAGTIMSFGGITRRLVRLANALVGHITGGLAQVNVFSSLLLSGMSGSATADASGLGSMIIPAMKKAGYAPRLSAAVTAASATIGPIIPPSVPFVIYGAMAQVSIGKLFVGGIIPGLLMTLFLMITIYLTCRRHGYRTHDKLEFGELFSAFKASLLDLMLPIVIIGGILGGIFTPIEAAAIAVVYAAAIELVIFREIGLRDIPQIVLTAARLTAVIMFVIAVSSIFGWILIREGAGKLLVDFMLGISSDVTILRILLVVFLIVLGLFIETIVLIVLVVPLLAALAPHLAMDPIHLGVTVVLSIMIGLITPPLGLCMFIVNSIAKIGMGEYTRTTIPYLAALIVCAFLVALVPPLTTWLPATLME